MLPVMMVAGAGFLPRIARAIARVRDTVQLDGSSACCMITFSFCDASIAWKDTFSTLIRLTRM